MARQVLKESPAQPFSKFPQATGIRPSRCRCTESDIDDRMLQVVGALKKYQHSRTRCHTHEECPGIPANVYCTRGFLRPESDCELLFAQRMSSGYRREHQPAMHQRVCSDLYDQLRRRRRVRNAGLQDARTAELYASHRRLNPRFRSRHTRSPSVNADLRKSGG